MWYYVSRYYFPLYPQSTFPTLSAIRTFHQTYQFHPERKFHLNCMISCNCLLILLNKVGGGGGLYIKNYHGYYYKYIINHNTHAVCQVQINTIKNLQGKRIFLMIIGCFKDVSAGTYTLYTFKCHVP
jgi:hypothetical protein